MFRNIKNCKLKKNMWRLKFSFQTTHIDSQHDGDFIWQTDVQGYVLSSFFYGYVITQIPFGILSKRYGSIYFLGVGMLINSLFGLLVPISANMGIWWLVAVRFIQGLGEVSSWSTQVQSETTRIFVQNQVMFFFGIGLRMPRMRQKLCCSLAFVPCIGFQLCTFLVRALLYHAHTLFWLNGSLLTREVEWVLSFMQVYFSAI